MVKINITTLGCPKNVVDSCRLSKAFLSEGFTCTDSIEEADILLVNTCGFIEDAKKESIDEILRLSELKKNGKKLLVFGCLAERYRKELFKEIPEIDSIWGIGEEHSIIEYCKDLYRSWVIGHRSSVESRFPITHSPSPISTSYTYLKIAEGCDRGCTFCVIPSIRGRFRSIHPETILKEAEGYVRQGVRELILIAQDITEYGKEFEEYSLTELLRDLSSIEGDFKIRLLYVNPQGITEKLIECIASEEKIQKYLDIPLQHSEDRILRLMGRRGTKKENTKLIIQIRRSIPQVAIRTTLIVGFPGETEENFLSLMDFVEDIRFDRLGVFKYSREEGTPASRLKEQVPERVKERRYAEIMKRQALISLEKNKELIGRSLDAVVDEVDGDIALGRLYSHAPEIDGVVIIEKIRDTGNSVKCGDILNVEITDAFDYDLKGIPVK